MAKKNQEKLPVEQQRVSSLQECLHHYDMWTEDNDIRATRRNGWNDVTDAYWGKLPGDWPYISRTVAPLIRTTLIEKNARLLNSKLRGRLIPREGSDIVKARLNNALLDFQWDNARDGGSMLMKWGIMDMDTRMYASKFALVPWRYEIDKKGEVIFDGNEMTPLDIRDCGMDPKATHIRNAKWFQHRKWEYIEDLEMQNATGTTQKYSGLSNLIDKMKQNSDRRDTEYESRVLNLKGLTDRVGQDKVFPVVELVTEYREDKWITFSPKYKCVLREIENPFNHKKIPVIQLRYYPLGEDAIGESEVEPVLPLWKAIQAVLCGFLDNMNIHMRPPLKIVATQARIETIEYGPEAQWIVDRQDAVMEFQGSGDPMKYFQTTFSALVAQFNNAMGDLSQGTSGVDPFNPEKTATEVKETSKQQNIRDQKNQSDLADAIQDMMMMWLSNNKQFLFSDPTKKEFVLRVVGSQMFDYFKRAGLDEEEVPDEAMQMISEIIGAQGGEVSDGEIVEMMESAKNPKFPVFENPDETDPNKLITKPKMKINEMGDAAELFLIPDDLDGTYDYIPDVKSMNSGADQERVNGIQRAIDRLSSNPTILQQLKEENVKPVIKELLISEFEELGLKDAEKYFQTFSPETEAPASTGIPSNLQQSGFPGAPTAIPQGPNQQQMAGSTQLSQ